MPRKKSEEVTSEDTEVQEFTHSDGFEAAAVAFKEESTKGNGEVLEAELAEGDYPDHNTMMAQLLEALGPEAYNKYVDQQWD